MSSKTPRPYQQERIDEASRRLIANETCAIVLPTGVGKTYTAVKTVDRVLSAPAATAGRALWLVDLVTLVDQTISAAAEEGVPIEVRTIQTRRPIKPGDYDCIVVDECHKFLTELRTERLLAAETPMLGLTATPRRGDGRHIQELFGEGYVCGPYTLGQAILDKWLCDAQVFRVELHELDLNAVKRRGADFDSGELAEAMNVPSHNEEIVERWRETARDDGSFAPSNFFCVDTAHADALAAEVNRQCGAGTCVAIHSNLPDGDGHERVKAFRQGRWQVVTSVMMVAEGFDFPALEVGVMARPTKSERLLVQKLGRFLRTHPGKKHATILDCVGSYEGLDLASIYDAIERPDVEDKALTESDDGPGAAEDDGIPMLSEVISRVREIDLFRRGVVDSRTLPWVLVPEWDVVEGLRRSARYALPVKGGHVIVAQSRRDPTKAVAAFIYHYGRNGTACYEVIADTVEEADAFHAAESWIRERYLPASWTWTDKMKLIRDVRKWFRNILPPSDEASFKITDNGREVPRQHGEAVRLLRRMYFRGEIQGPMTNSVMPQT